MQVTEILQRIEQSIPVLVPEISLSAGLLCAVVFSLSLKTSGNFALYFTLGLVLACGFIIYRDQMPATSMFGNMIQHDSFSSAFRIILDVAAFLTIILALRKKNLLNKCEFSILVISILLGGHFLLMSNHFLILFFALEMISIPSYVLSGFSYDKTSSEGSLKYFLFGSAASAIMLYGMSILYGVTGTLDFTSQTFFNGMADVDSSVIMIGGFMVLTGLLFKISAAPLHFWTPDVYQSAPMPVIAFFSVVPKIAGFGILTKFVISLTLSGTNAIDWQFILCIIAILTITIGNFGALAQDNVKRLMAYSSIAQSGFLLVGLCSFIPPGIHFLIFYACIYTVMNFLVFLKLQYFEEKGFANVADYVGSGKYAAVAHIFLLIGLISLTGLPPTAGFTGKLFIFSGLWESYALTGKPILLWLLIFGLVNTVVSLFYYLKIPYYAFLKERQSIEKQNFITFENLLGLILVLTVLALFFLPGILMGWINKVNFVL